jgi:hypothetical protein
MILADDLDPADVSKTLRLRASQSWKRGQKYAFSLQGGKSLDFSTVHEGGGWRKNLPASQAALPLSSQLLFWARTLRGRSKAIARLTAAGHLCILNCYIGTRETASVILPPDLQVGLAHLGLEIRLSVIAR